jgi:hypothetical protein
MSLCSVCSKESCNIFIYINRILSIKPTKENIADAIRIRNMIKQREDVVREKRQQLDALIYNNVGLIGTYTP